MLMMHMLIMLLCCCAVFDVYLYGVVRALYYAGTVRRYYFGPIGFNGLKGKPGKVKSKPHSYNEAVAAKLWEISEKLTGEKFIL